MRNDDILILKGSEIARLLDGRELEVIDAVKQAYIAHAAGQSSLPHSTFLRFPDNPLNRIIALPAYLGADLNTAGIKWVSSFPGNRELALDRASAIIILSSHTTGRPEAIIEGSIISARRTAASAALAAQHLHQGKDSSRVGVIGCGLISFEILRFLLASHGEIRNILIFDIDPGHAQSFRQYCAHEFPQVGVEVAGSVEEIMSGASLVALATTAATPHISDLSACQPGTTLLHISLRDLDPKVILSCDNIVDDVDHVCRAQTSVHLAEQLIGSRDFIRGTLADVINGKVSPRSAPDRIAIFSPFGLGVLDLAVSVLVRRDGILSGAGTVIDSFLPDSGLIKTNGNTTRNGNNHD